MDWIETLEKHGFVQLIDFLPPKQARQYRNKIVKAKHHKAWGLLTTPYEPLTRIKDNINSKVIHSARKNSALRAYKRKTFSFSFYRSNNKHMAQHGCADIHKSFSEIVIDRVAKPLNLSGALRDTFFASFKKGQFLSYHTDGSAGKYAFIYQLSTSWQPRFGGQLELYPRIHRFYKVVLEPKFNSLAILKLNHPMPHSVRMLNTPKHKHRITISGWLE